MIIFCMKKHKILYMCENKEEIIDYVSKSSVKYIKKSSIDKVFTANGIYYYDNTCAINMEYYFTNKNISDVYDYFEMYYIIKPIETRLKRIYKLKELGV